MAIDFNNPQTRRQWLARGLKGTVALSALGMRGTVLAAGTSRHLTPGVTEGPYWVDDFLVRSDVRTDPVTGITQAGLPLKLAINVSQLQSNGLVTPLRGAFVDIWQCNALGLYSDEAVENTAGEKFLRGLQATNLLGNVNFTTIYPGWYSGRTVHIHLRVRVYDFATESVTYNFVTQMFFLDKVTTSVFGSVAPYKSRAKRDTLNASDSIYTGPSEDNEVVANAGEYLLLQLAGDRSHLKGTFNVLMNLADAGYNNGLGGTSTGPTGGGPGGPPPGN